METPPPEVLALVIADQVYQDDDSGKLFVLGIRSTIGPSSFPLRHPHLAVYAALGNGKGTTEIRISLVDADEEREPLAESEATMQFPSPLAKVELVFELRDIVFPERGEYRLQLRSDGRFLCERVLVVLESKTKPDEDVK